MKKVLTVTMDGIRYHASRPADCRHCFFWKNRKKGCVLGKENCYYLIEPPKGPSKCEGCPYKRAKPCVLVPCYKDLMRYLNKQNIAPSIENYEILYRATSRKESAAFRKRSCWNNCTRNSTAPARRITMGTACRSAM